MIRCYLRHPLSESSPTVDVKQHFDFPEEDATLEQFYLAIQQHLQVRFRQFFSKNKIIFRLENDSLRQFRLSR